MKKHILFGIFLFITGWNYAQTIQIVEACNSNANILVDEDGDYNDWIELYNHSNTDTISLEGYYLSDNIDNLEKWAFPAAHILPHSFLIVQISGKDRNTLPHHWETVANGDSSWTYSTPFEQSFSEYLQWNQPDFDASNWLSGQGAFGHNYENINTIIPEDKYSVFMRHDFYLTDTTQVMDMVLHCFYDDGFVAYLNGYEVIRENMIHNGKKPYWNQSSFTNHPSKIDDSLAQPTAFAISPHLWKTLLKQGKNTVAIQLHNHWEDSTLLIKPWLSIAIADSIYQTDSLNSELPIPPTPLHTNFSIKNSGETIYLYHKENQHIQGMKIPADMPINTSCGVHWETTNPIVYFYKPTPGAYNSTPFLDIIRDSLQLLQPSGLYSTAVNVEITPIDSAYTIRYTTDGSIPNDSSAIYTESFSLDTNAVIRAAYFKDSLLHGPLSTAAYIINDTNNIDVFSIIIEPEDFFSDDKGINAFGYSYVQSYPYFEANFWQPWERQVLIQHFNTNKDVLWEQWAGIKIHGNYSRAYPQKSFGLYAKKKYGKKRFNYPLFSNKPYILSPKRFVLRNAGNDNRFAHLRDMLIHTRMQHTNADIQSGKTVAAYINAKYWGVYHLREKVDRYYLQNNWGVNPKEVNLLEMNGQIISGERNGFEDIMQYVKNHDFTDNNNYNWLQNRLDIENWIDFYITHIYHHNTDWPHHNTKFWNAPGFKWRQIVVDVDVSTNIQYSLNGPYLNSLDKISKDTISYSAIIYNKLLKNNHFKRQYINRFADLMNTLFVPENYKRLLDSITEAMDADMPKQEDKWGTPYYPNWTGVYIDAIKTYMEEKPDYMRLHLRQAYGLGTYDTIHLNIDSQGSGRIKLNTIYIDSTDWQGVYFDSIPVALEAIPYPGYEFVRWESSTSPQLADSGRVISSHYLQNSDDITAVFYSPTGGLDTLDIAFSEIAYKKFENADADDWIELLNREDEAIDLSAWTIRCDLPYKIWKLPDNVSLEAGERLLLVRDKALFTNLYPAVDTNRIIGDMPFGLNAAGEHIRLYDQWDRLVSEIHFTADSPWPIITGERAETIELINDDTDYHLPQNWQLSCPGGTPLMPSNTDCEETKPLLFTEINYKSTEEYDTKDWVEIFNNGEEAIDLSHCIFSDKDKKKHQYYFPDSTILQADSLFVIAKDTAKFFAHYPDIDKTRVFGPFDFGLSTKGENLSLHNRFGQTWIEVDYKNQAPWPQNADSTGYTIELRDTTLNMQEGSHWVAKCFLGTPLHLPNWCIQANSILISEILYNSKPTEYTGDWIELYNTNSRAVDLSDWSILHNTHDTLTFHQGFSIAADTFAIIAADSIAFTTQYPELDLTAVCFSQKAFDLDTLKGQLQVYNAWQHPGNLLKYDKQGGWPMITTDTNSRSLELVNYENTLLPQNWRIGCKNGSPLADTGSCNPDGIITWQQADMHILVYPNPAKNQVFIEVESKTAQMLEWQICNLQSQALQAAQPWRIMPGKQAKAIDIRHLSSGMYLLKLFNNETYTVQKLIIE